MKQKIILLAIFLVTGVSLNGVSVAGSCPDGSDPIKSISADGTYFVYNCGGAKDSVPKVKSESKVASNTNSSYEKDSKIKIYDVEFSPGVLDELLNLVISKTEYDFTQHRLSRNNKNVSCRFTMRRIIYENNPQGEIENWNMANGKIIFNGADVFLNGNWRMGGISGDPSYLEDEVNLKLTENGHLVGKMAYFNLTVSDGEAPRNPLYPVLKEHKRSIPIELKKDSIKSKQFIDVEDWAGGVLFVNNCNAI